MENDCDPNSPSLSRGRWESMIAVVGKTLSPIFNIERRWAGFLFVLEVLVLSSMATLSWAAGVQNPAGREWVPIVDRSLIVRSGSPLDFSHFVDGQPAGSSGRVVTVDGARMGFSKTGKVASFSCASLAWSPGTGGFPNHEDAALYARQLRMHGYNLVRFHYLDAIFMSGRVKDFDFDPEQFDRWQFFLARLKEQGIYWIFDAMSSPNGAIGNIRPHRWVRNEHDLKLGVYFEKADQEHWKNLVKKIYGGVNPYTGIRILEDPALVGFVLVNENGIDFYGPLAKVWPPEGLVREFNEWLNKKYSGTEVLKRAWGTLDDGESLESSSIKFPPVLKKASPRVADAMRFVEELEIKTTGWMRAYLNELGFQGLITNYHDSMVLASNAARSDLDWVDMHSYHDHVGDPIPGVGMEQSSSLRSALRYMRDAAQTRVFGKPFSLTEYGQPFWNRFRYEAGPVVGAMASLQGWDFACLHAWGPIDFALQNSGPVKKRLISPYVGGIDPIVRASETVASYIMLTRALKESLHRVSSTIKVPELYQGGGVDYIARDVTSLALLSKIGLDFSTSKTVADTEMSISPLVSSGRLLDKLGRLATGSNVLQTHVAEMRKRNFLAPDNLTNPAKGVFQSDTKEILLDTEAGVFTVIAPNVEVLLASEAVKDKKMNVSTVEKIYSSGMIAFMSLDGRPLKNSTKILLVFATDADNTDIQFMDGERRVIKSLGTFPPRIRRGSAMLSMRINDAATVKLNALHLNGDMGDEIPLSYSKGVVKFGLGNADFTHGPTTFYVLTRK